MDNLGHKRQSYEMHTLDREDLEKHPIDQFEKWYHDAEHVKIVEPNIMSLATVNAEAKPSVRIVLLKGFAKEGFAFYTNYGSQKASDLESNPHASLAFWWDKLQRQVRIEGVCSKIPAEQSEKYFQSRPRGSQLSAWASPQSHIITKEQLIERRRETEDRFQSEDPLPLPDAWGGFLLKPTALEFWQGRENRYHDRFRYELDNEDGSWSVSRLAP